MTADKNGSKNNGTTLSFEEEAVRLTEGLPEQFAESRRHQDKIGKNLKGLGFDV